MYGAVGSVCMDVCGMWFLCPVIPLANNRMFSPSIVPSLPLLPCLSVTACFLRRWQGRVRAYGVKGLWVVTRCHTYSHAPSCSFESYPRAWDASMGWGRVGFRV